jgi:curved DNA-binding protein CbpA
MNYYEELAVAQDASLEEIHQAYRALARLLHPDSQSDPKLKSAAERQMIRLNEILAILADPEKRRKYNESLCQKLTVFETAPPPALASSLPLRRQLPWILAVCILVGVGIWYLRSNESGDAPADRGPAPSTGRSVQPAQTTPPEITPPASESRPLSENRLPKRSPVRPQASLPAEDFNPVENSAPGEPAHRLPAPGEAVAVPRVAVKAELPAPPPQTVPSTPAQSQRAAEQPSAPAFAGHWFYSLGAHDAQTPGMYPPEFIEFFLSEEQGVLTGKYWARYRIPDKPVSPEVQFRVTGAPQKGDITTLKWVSDDGAHGQMKVVLRGSNSMEVTWWTTAFGRQTALTSGTAVLVRQQAR